VRLSEVWNRRKNPTFDWIVFQICLLTRYVDRLGRGSIKLETRTHIISNGNNMTPNLKLALLSIGTALLVCLLLAPAATCARTSKDNSRPKLKCLKNVTTLITEPQTQFAITNSKCVTLSHPYCLDIKLPYNSIALLPDSFPDLNLKTFEDVQNFLDKWRHLQKLPTCWPILQVALCSLLMPKCEEDPLTGRIVQFHQPNVDICSELINFNKTNCKFIQKQLVEEWPSLFTCNDTNLYAKNCTNELRDLKYSLGASSKQVCQYPLVPTNDNQSWFKDIEGCALHCKFPISSSYDQASISLVIKCLCLVGLTSTIVAIILFKFNKASSKSSRMAKVIKRCTICQLLIYIGWSLQIFFNHEVGCKTDGSQLYGQPLVANSCILSFILTYLPSLSSLFWCAHLGKLCQEKLTGNEDKSANNSEIDRTLSLFNYGIPLTLFVSVAFLGHIDGHGLYGICTVGQKSVLIKTIFVFVPSLVGTLYGNYFFARIIFKLAFVRTTTMKPSLRRNFIRISALATLSTLQAIFSVINYFYESNYQHEWVQAIEHYVGCQLNLNNIDSMVSQHDYTRQQQECVISSKPFITLYYIEILSTLTVGVIISSWAFYDSNYKGLRRKLIDILEDDKDRQRRVKTYLLKEPNASSRRQNWLTNKSEAELDETYHDLIDMTSPTRCAGGEKGDNGSDDSMDPANNELVEQQVDIPCTDAASTGARISRRASLQSVTLTNISVYNSESSSMVNGYAIPMVMAKNSGRHHRGGANRRGKTSRDVVNDCKQQRVSNQLQNINGQETRQQADLVVAQTALMVNMIKMMEQFNPSDLSKLQSDPDRQPHFNHGFAEFHNEQGA
jgi:hypothetical protein